MTTLCKTESGSLYELDSVNKQVRRIEGVGPCLPRVGQDGVWKEFTAVNEPKVGKSLAIIWRWDNVDGLLIARSTITSLIVEIREKD